jgi:3-hydroxyisobutyrate dehydrogenase-like beta-hydroxyacid dehydrogenase
VTKNNIIGLIGMGDMGHNVAKYLIKSNFKIVTNLDHRSKKSIDTAKSLKIEILELNEFINKSHLIISIIPPSAAYDTAKILSDYSKKLSKPITYIDANAISPKTTLLIENEFYISSYKSSKYIDGSIIGGPPNKSYKPRLYVSGKYAEEVSYLNSLAFDIINLGNETQLASSIKMCYASLTKGTSALLLSLILLADKLEVSNYLFEELEYSQQETLDKIMNSFPSIANKSSRWIAEMEEIASTYVDNEQSPGVFDNASYIYRLLSKNKKQFSKLIAENF